MPCFKLDGVGPVDNLTLQKLVRKKMREYEKHGFSEHFKELKKKVKERVKLEGEKALNKVFKMQQERALNGSENQID